MQFSFVVIILENIYLVFVYNRSPHASKFVSRLESVPTDIISNWNSDFTQRHCTNNIYW